MRLIRKLYDWVLSWANSRWGAVALFVIAFAESSFFPIPPDVLLIALCLGMPRKAFRYALICTAGSVLGGLAGYGIGYFVWEGVSHWFIPSLFTQEAFDHVSGLYDQYAFWVIFTSGFTPIPYKLFTITGGVCAVDMVAFVLACVLSRGIRFFFVAWLIWKFGPPIKKFIDKYFNWLAIGFTVLVVSGFVLIKYIV